MNGQSSPAISDGGTQLDVGVFRRVAALAEREAGLAIPEAKRSMVQSRLNRRLRATGIGGFPAYLDFVESRDGAGERAQMISALTTNVSHFFREEHHFTLLRQDVLPKVSAPHRTRRLRIWSAGCSTGQEPYSIAMTLIDAMTDISGCDIRILASDIDRTVLATARAGRYGERDLAGVPQAMRSRFFKREGEEHIVRNELRRLISFRELNLMDQWPMQGPFDAIFCRNVLIYFSEETQNALWPRFARLLSPSGRLYLGHSERMSNPSDLGFHTSGVTAYTKSAARV